MLYIFILVQTNRLYYMWEERKYRGSTSNIFDFLKKKNWYDFYCINTWSRTFCLRANDTSFFKKKSRKWHLPRRRYILAKKGSDWAILIHVSIYIRFFDTQKFLKREKAREKAPHVLRWRPTTRKSNTAVDILHNSKTWELLEKKPIYFFASF